MKPILPLGPGSGTDTVARLFADRLSKRWGQPVVVENRPGGDAMIAIQAFLAANDDQTLLFTATSAYTGHPYLHDKLPYDPAAHWSRPQNESATRWWWSRCRPR